MASELNISEANIRNFINGSYPKIEFIFTICKKLDINYEWLLLGKVNMLRLQVDKVDRENEIIKKEQYYYAMQLIDIQKKYISNLENELKTKNEHAQPDHYTVHHEN
jgi:hypothetical protein